ncbi:MAG TPA: TauD/TfdA family dioxygenase, partial [Acetobacteraceae bacterium]|nr:TauD/TfdA family dioxygenase [Acetobacteraceae bacterium]
MSSLSGNQGPRIRARDGDAAPYEAITLDRLTPVIGAEIGSVDLGNLSNRQFDEIHRALAETGAIFFRDQRITPEQHLDFGRRFGE